MIILYISKEPYSPAFLEASLIEKFRSSLVALLNMCRWTDVPLGFLSMFTRNQGVPGCRNIQLGGDNVKAAKSASDVDSKYMTYVVYRSFRTTPAKQG